MGPVPSYASRIMVTARQVQFALSPQSIAATAYPIVAFGAGAAHRRLSVLKSLVELGPVDALAGAGLPVGALSGRFPGEAGVPGERD